MPILTLETQLQSNFLSLDSLQIKLNINMLNRKQNKIVLTKPRSYPNWTENSLYSGWKKHLSLRNIQILTAEQYAQKKKKNLKKISQPKKKNHHRTKKHPTTHYTA